MIFYFLGTVFSILFVSRLAPFSFYYNILTSLISTVYFSYHFIVLYSVHKKFKREFDGGFVPKCHNPLKDYTPLEYDILWKNIVTIKTKYLKHHFHFCFLYFINLAKLNSPTKLLMTKFCILLGQNLKNSCLGKKLWYFESQPLNFLRNPHFLQLFVIRTT